MYLTTTGTTVLTLTRLGRELLADNSSLFKITQFAFSDDEINYADFDGSSVDASQSTILRTPVLEACTFGNVPSQRYTLESFSFDTLQVARLDSGVQRAWIDGKQSQRPVRNSADIFVRWNRGSSFDLDIRTLYGNDPSYFARSLNSDILSTPAALVSSVPCSDPYESKQNQTQAVIRVTQSLSLDSDVSQLDPRLRSAFEATRTANSSTVSARTVAAPPVETTEDNRPTEVPSGGGGSTSGRPTPSTASPTTEQSPVTPSPSEPNRQPTQIFRNVGLASTVIEVTGTNTGKKFYFNVLIYNPAVVNI